MYKNTLNASFCCAEGSQIVVINLNNQSEKAFVRLTEFIASIHSMAFPSSHSPILQSSKSPFFFRYLPQIATPLHLQQLKLTNFKNYEWQEITCSPAINCFVGLNGMGKTNLLDAVYYICMGKSHNGLSDVNVVLHDADFFRIEAIFEKDKKQDKVVAKVIPRKRKEFERNNVPYGKLSDHIGIYPVVIIAPNDTNIVLEGSEIRRRFVDNTLSQIDPAYLNALIAYNKVLQQRNAALKQFSETRSFNAGLLEVYNLQLIEPAQIIQARRERLVKDFNPVFQAMYEAISGAREVVDCQYKSKLSDTSFPELLAEALEKDRILQRTTVGIHRDDLILQIDTHPAKQFASQGQLKSLALALKLAQYELLRREKNMRPILLLDDIFDKLDKNRVQHLLELLLAQSFGQIFLTDTDEERVRDILGKLETSYHLFHIENGNANLSLTT